MRLLETTIATRLKHRGRQNNQSTGTKRVKVVLNILERFTRKFELPNSDPMITFYHCLFWPRQPERLKATITNGTVLEKTVT